MKIKPYLLLLCLSLSLTGCGGKNSTNPEQGDGGHVHKFEMQYQSTPSCKQEGKRVEKCSCGQTQTIVLEKTSHTYKEKIKERATCSKPGVKSQKCSVCGHEIEEEIPQIEHTWKMLRTTEATCSQDGVEVKQCDKCKQQTEVVIPKKEHTFHKETIDATCTQKGKEQIVCLWCDDVELIKELPLIDHDYELVEKEPSTCTKDGILEKTCKYCKKKITSVLPKVDHVMVEKEQAATCTENGYKRMECKDCGQIANEIIHIAPGHISVAKTVLNPTCTEPGLIEHTCSVCGEVEKEEIEPKGHSYSRYERLPTCTEIGYNMRKCDSCGDIQDYVEIPAKGHRHIELRRTEPTCIREGSVEKVCSVCMEVTVETLATIPHQYELVSEDSEWRHYECINCYSTKKDKK